MKGIVARVLGLIFTVAAVSVALTAETPKPKTDRVPLVTDWSHQHVIFSHPRTPERAAKLQGNIRYLQQEQRHSVHPVISKKVDPESRRRFRRMRRRFGRHLHRDWSWDLGPGATVGAGRYPAKYGFDSTVANCGLATNPDFVVYPTNLLGAVGQASIVAATNLYSGCGGPLPANFWGYNTAGIVNTSPALSLDGTQVAFVQNDGISSTLVILKWLKFDGSVQSPSVPTPQIPSAYLGCTAPCMTTFVLGALDTNSSVYYDFQTDVAFVGDDAGFLHQYTGVFKGTPTEVLGNWPVQVGAPLTSAVFDPNTGNTFVNDTGGFLYRVDSTGATVTASARLDHGTGFTGGPVLDLGTGSVYAFSSGDAGLANAAVFQLSEGFAASDTGTEVTIGAASVTTPVYNGGFDHNYIFSEDPGHIYVCGNPGGNPTLYQIPVVAGVIQTAIAGPPLSGTSGATCSPVTDIYNATVPGQGLPEEWTFASVQANGTVGACNGHSCIMNFRVSSWQPNTIYNLGQLVLDSNLNIQVVDHIGTSAATQPAWQTNVFGPPTNDGLTLRWRNQGPLSTQTPPPWQANFLYTGAFQIVDTNNNIEIVSNLGGGTSSGTQPTWQTAEGTTQNDGGVIWYNMGANPVSGLQAPGGTSGIIMDNTVNANGSSQVYFSNLQDFSCDIGNGGCAVQASQQGLN